MKQSLERYIADLLYRYDLVTVPDLGTFIGRRRPAYYVDEKATFFPPSKAITFNPRLTDDDGTLTDAVARGEKINRETARQFVRRFVDSWLEELDRSGRLYLKGLGTLAREQGKLLFTPLAETNFLPEAFGLHPVVRAKQKPEAGPVAAEHAVAGSAKDAPVVQPVESPKKKIRHTEFHPQILDFTPPAERSGLRVRPWMGVAAALLIGGFLVWQQPGKRSTALPAGVQHAGYSLHESFPPVHLYSPKTQTTARSTTDTARPFEQNSTGRTEPAYWLIAGAFRARSNAERLVADLQKRFPRARLAGTNAKGLYLVAVDGASDPQTARTLKSELSARGVHTWIWRRP